ncbi:peptidase M50B-like-domain-containing protein [Leucosporidium creatinivorum]|uniref:Peptidase M50B-like-domain-containing protein n=1 Tax=Leucosporidium creatinivorum TaxID=106004 RepID=A0A1Y2G3T4_9BASI|nr:peptidase M50B-like-domain-containing protein [Leucosporidium creatinivorum]
MIYFVTLLLCWNLKYARTIIFPFKLLTVAFHESCHAIAGTLTGAKITSMQLDPNEGGATAMSGGFAFFSLPAGYIGSTFIGSALIFAGFDQKASKIAVFPVLFIMCCCMWWARKDMFVICHVTFSMGIMAALFIIEHGAFLRFFILFVGTMNGEYTVWDILDDLVFQKIEESDCSAFTREYPWMPAQAWGTIWLFIAFSGLALGVIGGLTIFKGNFEEQYLESMTFLAT